jgi:hypothetical protein
MNKLKPILTGKNPVTPLKLAIVYQLFLMVYMIKINSAPSVIAWAFLIAIMVLVFVTIIFVMDYLIIKYVKYHVAFWIIQIVLFSLLIWCFVKEGFPPRL